MIKDVVEKRVHVLVCTSSGGGPLLVGGICATPLLRVDPCPPCNGKRQGRVCLNRGPNCFDVSRPVVPGGARHTWGVAPAAIHHPVGPQLFLHKLPAILDLHLKPRKFGSKTGTAAPHRPNFGRLDQSMQITAAMQLHLHLKR